MALSLIHICRNIDKWFCGSYRDYIPDHYELGYQICSYAYARYDENVWDLSLIHIWKTTIRRRRRHGSRPSMP